jgi:mannose-6-phosphate isomerase-like protein (cupin superfamily)
MSRTGVEHMAGIAKKSFESPDERRTPDKAEVQVVDLGSVKAARMTLQPGWRWSECIKPLAVTESCEVHHVGTVAAGTLHIRHNDGTEIEVGPGDAYVIEPGHDAWVIGSDPFVAYEFDSGAAETFART